MRISHVTLVLFVLAILVPALLGAGAFRTFFMGSPEMGSPQMGSPQTGSPQTGSPSVPLPGSQPRSWLNGSLAQAFEAHYETASPLRTWGINTWAALQLVLFREGRPGVYVGQDGWLFSSEELYGQSGEAENVTANLAAVKRAAEVLAKQGVGLLLVPIPAKARIEQQGMDDRARRRFARLTRLEQLSAFADEQQIPQIDLLPFMTSARIEGNVFLRTDTHWQPAIARAAAARIAKAVSADWPSLTGPSGTLEVLPETSHVGDLLSFLPLGERLSWLGPGPESVQSYRLDAAGGVSATDLFGDQSFRVVLVGTSYSANTLWCFADCLEAALGTPILNLASAGGGPLQPMLDFLASERLQTEPPELVIWEFPERFLGFDYDLPAADSSAYHSDDEIEVPEP